MAQIITITSEALQATVRRLLPSQQGFGEDLQAQNVITPIIDLTPTAEGSALPTDLARASSWGAITEFDNDNNFTDVASTPGFYRIYGVSTVELAGIGVSTTFIELRGPSNRTLWMHRFNSTNSSVDNSTTQFDFTVFLDTGITMRTASLTAGARLSGASYNVADRYGNLTNPSGFTFE